MPSKNSNGMYTKIIFAIFTVILHVIAKSEASKSRLVGGHEAPLQFGEFHVSLQNLTGHHVCGGAVISRKHVITAAHCVVGAEPEYIKAVVGTTNLDEGGRQHDIVSINIHKDYNRRLRNNDIAIIKIEGRFSLEDVEILDIHEENLVEGEILAISGFGAHEPNGVSSRQLYVLISPVFSQETCKYAMRYNLNITDSMFCTFTRLGEGMCHGDSGGPLVRHNRLVGVVSWGIPCATGFPDVHTRITPFISWIREEIKYANCQP